MKFKPFSHHGVDVHVESVTIPTYLQGPADPNPPILVKGIRAIYPHTWQKSFTERIEPRRYDALVLTSRWIRAVVLPDWGMHLYRAIDMVTGRDMFHCPSVFRSAHNALRGAYVAGGVEMNFPVGHTMMTASRVGVYIRKAPGGVQLLFHNTDRRSGLACAVGFTLAGDFRGILFDQYFHNPTPLPQPWYYWLNAGLTPHRSLRFLFPSPEMLGHFEGPWMETANRYPWPVHQGLDYSRFEQAPEPVGLFSQAHMAGWFGAWYDDWDFGVVRWAPPWRVAGQKFWTWGNSEEGMLWSKIGGEGELPVPEIQSGRPETQMDRGVLRPYAVTSHREWWMPVAGIGDVQAVSRFGAMAVQREGKTVRVRMSPACDISAAWIEVNGQRVRSHGHAKTVELKTGKVFERVLHVPAGELTSVAIVSPCGKTLEWSVRTSATATNVTSLETRLQPAAELGPNALVHLGRRWQRCFRPDLAEEHYRRAMAKEPANSQALLQLGLLALEDDRPEEARTHLAAAIEANRWCDQALYLHALACLFSGDEIQAQADFTRAAATGDSWAIPAVVQLALASRRKGDDLQANAIIADGLAREPNNPTLLRMSSRCGSNMCGAPTGDSGVTLKMLDVVLGVCPVARNERRLAKLSDSWAYIPADNAFDDDQRIALALGYAEMSEVKETARLLKAVKSDAGKSRAAYLMRWIGHANPDKVNSLFFGWGREDRQALELAVREQPLDAVAQFALGCLLAEQRKLSPAIEHLQAAAMLRKNDSVVLVALATVLLETGLVAEAASQLESAVALKPANPTAWVRLDEAMRMDGRRDRAWLARFAAAGAEVLDNEEARQCLARLACDLWQFDQAADLLTGREFHPYELTHELRDLWSEIHRRKAVALAMAGQFEPAIRSIRLALEYPPNLALGRPHRRFDAPTLYAAGCIFEAAGDVAGAHAYFEQAAQEDQPDPTPAKPWSILAQIRLGLALCGTATPSATHTTRLAELVRQTQACLDADFHRHLSTRLREILALCQRIEDGYMPVLADLAQSDGVNL